MTPQTKQLCQTPYSKDPQYLMALFSAVANQTMDCQLTIQQIKSASVFPEMVSAHGKHTLYWDLQYWEFFQRFLLELSYLLENSAYGDRFTERVLAICYDYLSLKLLHIPELAYCIQVNRERKFSAQDKTVAAASLGTLELIGSNYESGVYYSRFLVFYHEFFHLYYKLNPTAKVEDLKRLNKLAELYCGGDWLTDLANDEMSSLLMEGFQTLLHSEPDKLLEEASCDYRALIETISMQRKLTNKDQIFAHELQEIHDAFHMNQTFLSYLTNISSCWEILYKTYQRVDSYEELLQRSQPYFDKAAHMAIIRNSIIPDFLDKLNIKKYDMPSYISILDKPYIKAAIHKVGDQMVDLDFMLYAIEESIRLSRLPHYDPFELKNIVLRNAGYRTAAE